LAVTAKSTVPGPVDAALETSDSQSPVPVTDHAQSWRVATVTLPRPPSAAKVWLVVERVKEQGSVGAEGEEDPHAEATTRSVTAPAANPAEHAWGCDVVLIGDPLG
jgi:hypothetical protein